MSAAQSAIDTAHRILGPRVLGAIVTSDRYLSVTVATGHRWGKLNLRALLDLADALDVGDDQVEVWDVLAPDGRGDRVEVCVDLLEATPVERPAGRRR